MYPPYVKNEDHKQKITATTTVDGSRIKSDLVSTHMFSLEVKLGKDKTTTAHLLYVAPPADGRKISAKPQNLHHTQKEPERNIPPRTTRKKRTGKPSSHEKTRIIFTPKTNHHTIALHKALPRIHEGIYRLFRLTILNATRQTPDDSPPRITRYVLYCALIVHVSHD